MCEAATAAAAAVAAAAAAAAAANLWVRVRGVGEGAAPRALVSGVLDLLVLGLGTCEVGLAGRSVLYGGERDGRDGERAVKRVGVRPAAPVPACRCIPAV